MWTANCCAPSMMSKCQHWRAQVHTTSTNAAPLELAEGQRLGWYLVGNDAKENKVDGAQRNGSLLRYIGAGGNYCCQKHGPYSGCTVVATLQSVTCPTLRMAVQNFLQVRAFAFAVNKDSTLLQAVRGERLECWSSKPGSSSATDKGETSSSL